MFKAQQRIGALFSDQAAGNAAKQFNASSENQMEQFFKQLQTQVQQFNTSQTNAMQQFNAGQATSISQFNTQIQNQRDQFNAQNQLVSLMHSGVDRLLRLTPQLPTGQMKLMHNLHLLYHNRLIKICGKKGLTIFKGHLQQQKMQHKEQVRWLYRRCKLQEK